MSNVNKKRPAETTTASPAPKRSATRKPSETVTIDEDETNTETYIITAKLSNKYNVFPGYLRQVLQASYQTTIQRQMAALLSGIPLKFNITFSVIIETRIRQPDPIIEPNVTTYKNNVVSLSLANTILVELFMKTQGEYLEKPNFVMLPKLDGMANPDFTRLHATRHNEIGWGFDIYGCLSLFLVYIHEGKLEEYVIYVQRAQVKVEEKA
jgi:hypothetical protein